MTTAVLLGFWPWHSSEALRATWEGLCAGRSGVGTITKFDATACAARIAAEVKTGNGRIDAVIEVSEHIYLFEFKLNKDAMVALDQIQDKAYYQKYRLHGKPVTQVGVNFDTATRTVTDWKSAPVELRT